MANQYKIYPEYKFGYSKLEPGNKSFEELYDLALKFRKDKDFSKVIYQLSDLRGCIFDFDRSRMGEMIDLINLFKVQDNQKIGVYLVDNPIETATVHLFFNRLKLKRKYCSTIKKAYNLLDLPFSYEKFTELTNF